MVIDGNLISRFPLLGHNLAQINSHRFFALDFESLLSNILRSELILALWIKYICRQLDVLRVIVFFKVLEVRLEIEIYLLDPIGISFFSYLDLNISDLSPLIIELIFQEFTRLHIEHYDFLWTKFKFQIDFLEFGYFLLEVFFLFLLLLHVLFNT